MYGFKDYDGTCIESYKYMLLCTFKFRSFLANLFAIACSVQSSFSQKARHSKPGCAQIVLRALLSCSTVDAEFSCRQMVKVSLLASARQQCTTVPHLRKRLLVLLQRFYLVNCYFGDHDILCLQVTSTPTPKSNDVYLLQRANELLVIMPFPSSINHPSDDIQGHKWAHRTAGACCLPHRVSG